MEIVAVLAGYGALVVLISWPLATNLSSEIAGGGHGGDAAGYVWDFWFNAREGLSLWGSTLQEMIGAPFGRLSPGSVNVTLLTTVGPGYVLARIWGPVVAYNVLDMAALALSGSSMYLLVRWLRLGVWPAIWAGVAFVICPYEQLRSTAHIPLAQIWCFPLVIIAGLRWLEQPSWRRAWWLTAALALCWLTNPYYGAMGGVMVATFVAVGAIRILRARGGHAVRSAVGAIGRVAAWTVLVIAIPLGLLFTAGQGAIDGALLRPVTDLELYGARLTDYVLPSYQSPFFDTVAGGDRWAGIGGPGGERTVFVGYGTIVLALIGLAYAWFRRSSFSVTQRLAVISGLALIPVLVLFSLASPTRWGGHAITMPSKLVYEALPYLRVYARFGVAVMAVLVMLAALGLAMLIRNRPEVFQVSIVALALIVSAVELPIGAPAGVVVPSDVALRVNGVDPQDVPTWAWLRDHGDGRIVYEQPGLPNELLERYFMWGQMIHKQPLTNGILTNASIGFDFQKSNGDVRWPGQPERLAALGIARVTVSPWAYAFAGIPAPDPAKPPAGYEVEASFPDGSAIWRVTATPADAVAIPRSEGWWDPEWRDGGLWHWMGGSRSVVTVVAPEAGAYRVRFLAAPRPGSGGYVLTVTGPEGGEVERVPVLGRTQVDFTMHFPKGRSDVIVTPDKPPRRMAGDDREVTVRTTDWNLTRVR
jgi:hypothetical protein